MNGWIVFLPPLLSFLSTLWLVPRWIKAAKRVGLVGKDMNKYEKPEVAEMGGIAVIVGFLAGVVMLAGIQVFVHHNSGLVPFIYGATLTTLAIAVMGMIDDILGWKIGLRQVHKPIITFLAGYILAAVNAGKSTMALPFIGAVDFGIVYPLLIVPAGIMLASNAFNMLAGYNGLEAGMGVIILSTLSYVAYRDGLIWLATMGVIMVASLLAFLIFNWYPARVFPGDTLTYGVGAFIACMAILGNMEKLAVTIFLPYYFDFLLPLRKRFKTEAFAKVKKDNSLDLPYDGIYDVTHFAIWFLKRIKKKVYEKDVVVFILLLEAIICLAALILI